MNNPHEMLREQIKTALKSVKSEIEDALADVNAAIKCDDNDLYGLRRRIRCASSMLNSSVYKLSRCDGMSELWNLTKEESREEQKEEKQE